MRVCFLKRTTGGAFHHEVNLAPLTAAAAPLTDMCLAWNPLVAVSAVLDGEVKRAAKPMSLASVSTSWSFVMLLNEITSGMM